jgi:hypothetical protein
MTSRRHDPSSSNLRRKSFSETPHHLGHVSDGISLRGEGLDFTDFSQNEMGLEGGVMFYGPGSD